MMRPIILISYMALLTLGSAGIALWVPPETIPRALPMMLFCLPLLLPLRGVLHGVVRSHVWLGFLSFAYFIIGVDTAYNRIDDERLFGLLVLLFSVTLFLSTMLWIRQQGRQ